ncbi:multiprotein bridging factor aMBF1 [Methanolacinia petrolearia]|uniref:multiprotein bridging factor aMBF1 n=1 Tax=Methanolacinia petrolearia TaxID=54120 RepID=UPI003BAA33E1
MFAINMSECEVCGCIIRGKPILVQIGGAKMWVCSNCAKLGTEIQRPGMDAIKKGSPGMVSARSGFRSVSPQKKKSRDVFDMIDGEIDEDFSDIIRDARMSKGLSQKELAMQIKEKEGLIKKIEKGMIPEDSVRKKIEEALSIKLTESSDVGVKTGPKGGIEPTLGEVMKIKKGK